MLTSPTSLFRRSLAAALLLAASGAGCADDPGMMDDPIEEPPPDTEAPFVVDTVPAANATGIAADDKIFITFSEPMDTASVEAAFASEDLPPGAASFAWDADHTVLTITPQEPLEYAEGEGTDLSLVPPRTYAIAIGTGATDVAGNALEQPLSLSFATRRRMLAVFELDGMLTRALRDTIVLGGENAWAGDGANGDRYHSYLTFDLAELPAGSDVELASFRGRQLAPMGAPYNLGPVVAEHVTFGAITGSAMGSLEAMSQPGVFSSDAVEQFKTIDVTSQVQDDVANRAEREDRSQYRLQIEQATNGDEVADLAAFEKASFRMYIQYIAD